MPAFLGSKYRVFWSHMETVNSIEDIQHAGVRGCLQFLNIQDGIEINHAGDLPARSGLGSSSAFTVGMLSALHALRGDNRIHPGQLASEAIKVEQEVLHETVGIQDQIACAWGSLSMIKINSAGQYSITPIILPTGRMEELEGRLMLFFTGIQRYASEIAKTQIENTEQNSGDLKAIVNQVSEAIKILEKRPLDEFGILLDDAWRLKRRLSNKISSPSIDTIYDRAIKAGALGGKLLGAGGGGFFLFYVPLKKQGAVRNALGLYEVPVRFETSGSQIVLKS